MLLNLYKGGVSPKVIQSLARHSTFGLTMDTYTHIGLYDERTALDKLPELPNIDNNKSETERAVSRKTGTDDLPVTVYKPVYKEFAKKTFPDTNHSLPVGTQKGRCSESELKDSGIDKDLPVKQLGVKTSLMSSADNSEKNNWAGLDSNQRKLTLMGLQPIPFSHSGTDPFFSHLASRSTLDAPRKAQFTFCLNILQEEFYPLTFVFRQHRLFTNPAAISIITGNLPM